MEAEGVSGRFEDLRIGDHLKVHARLLDGQRILATELERTTPSTSIVVHAPVRSAADPLIVLADTSIDTSRIPDKDLVGLYGTIGRAAFFEKMVIGRPVWVKGILTGSIATWSSVGIDR
jgi:hypothetical protein